MGCEKPPRNRQDALDAVEKLIDHGRTALLQLLNTFEEPFWKSKRKEQIAKLLEGVEGSGTTQKDISIVMGVSEKTVSKTKYQLQKDGDVTPKGGRPSTMAEVFPRVCDFIKKELEAGRSVTLGVLVEYISKKLGENVERRVVREFMKSHCFSFVTGVPTEDMRVKADQDKLSFSCPSCLRRWKECIHPSFTTWMKWAARDTPTASSSRSSSRMEWHTETAWQSASHERPTAAHSWRASPLMAHASLRQSSQRTKP